MTTKDVLAMNWKTLRGKMRERWHSLTDEDINIINGNYDVLVGMLQERYFYSREVAERDVNHFLNEFAMTNQPMHA